MEIGGLAAAASPHLAAWPARQGQRLMLRIVAARRDLLAKAFRAIDEEFDDAIGKSRARESRGTGAVD